MASSIAVDYSGGTPFMSGSGTTNTSSPNNFSQTVNAGLYTVSITLPGGDWQVICNSCGTTSASCGNADVPTGGSNTPFFFSLYNNPQPWFTSIDGNVYSSYCGALTNDEASCATTTNSAIVDPIPGTISGGYEPYLVADSSNGGLAGGIAISRANTGGQNCGGGNCSERGYTVTDYGYIPWPQILSDLSSPGTYGNVLVVNGPITVTEANKSTYDNKVVIVNGGDVTFDNSFGSVAAGRSGADLTAVFVANQGQIIIENSDGVKNFALSGGLYARNGLIFNRTLTDNKFPSVIVTYNPALVLSSLILSEPLYSWREVPVE